MKKIFFLILAGVVMFSALGGCKDAGQSDGSSGGLREFQAVTLDGGSFSQDDIGDKDLTVINFWGTFCGPCLDEMPDLADFAKALPENIQFITVCVDGEGDPESAKLILWEAGYEGETLISGDGDFENLLAAVQAIPTTVFVDSGGSLVGEAIVGGGHKDLSQVFLDGVNKALKEGGKEEISLEG